jgi:hypothetical protein
MVQARVMRCPGIKKMQYSAHLPVCVIRGGRGLMKLWASAQSSDPKIIAAGGINHPGSGLDWA